MKPSIALVHLTCRRTQHLGFFLFISIEKKKKNYRRKKCDSIVHLILRISVVVVVGALAFGWAAIELAFKPWLEPPWTSSTLLQILTTSISTPVLRSRPTKLPLPPPPAPLINPPINNY